VFGSPGQPSISHPNREFHNFSCLVARLSHSGTAQLHRKSPLSLSDREARFELRKSAGLSSPEIPAHVGPAHSPTGVKPLHPHFPPLSTLSLVHELLHLRRPPPPISMPASGTSANAGLRLLNAGLGRRQLKSTAASSNRRCQLKSTPAMSSAARASPRADRASPRRPP
jgi:hypothetical protein